MIQSIVNPPPAISSEDGCGEEPKEVWLAYCFRLSSFSAAAMQWRSGSAQRAPHALRSSTTVALQRMIMSKQCKPEWRDAIVLFDREALPIGTNSGHAALQAHRSQGLDTSRAGLLKNYYNLFGSLALTDHAMGVSSQVLLQTSNHQQRTLTTPRSESLSVTEASAVPKA
ncbi:hypothetical protein SCUP234_12386 [Seiridium cupressi]